ncbi:MAG: ribonuclease HII [Candidatus Absconditabacterales bacterium]|nr:ribonuclease HII [Candidatus Absconditabacterales bacterium]
MMAVVCARGYSPVLDLCQDSKILSASRRQLLAQKILADPNLVCHTVFFSASDIDRYGLAYGLKTCLISLVDFLSTLSISVDCVMDGPTVRGVRGSHYVSVRPMVRADSLVPVVSAASILAKVARDSWVCDQLDPLYPQYGFARHKGYGTRFHRIALEMYGLCPEHRASFSLFVTS